MSQATTLSVPVIASTNMHSPTPATVVATISSYDSKASKKRGRPRKRPTIDPKSPFANDECRSIDHVGRIGKNNYYGGIEIATPGTNFSNPMLLRVGAKVHIFNIDHIEGLYRVAYIYERVPDTAGSVSTSTSPTIDFFPIKTDYDLSFVDDDMQNDYEHQLSEVMISGSYQMIRNILDPPEDFHGTRKITSMIDIRRAFHNKNEREKRAQSAAKKAGPPFMQVKRHFEETSPNPIPFEDWIANFVRNQIGPVEARLERLEKQLEDQSVQQ